MIQKAKKHLDSVHESYFLHMLFALRIAGLSFLAAVSLIIHAVVPAVLEYTGSTLLERIHALISERKKQRNAALSA